MLIPRSFISATLFFSLFAFVFGNPHNIHKRHYGSSSHYSENHALEKRAEFNNVKFSWYHAGQGACGKVNKDSDFIVAMNPSQFSNSQCFKTITMSLNGKTTQAQVVDLCPGCPFGGLDLSPGLFSFFEDLGQGTTFAGAWSWGDGGAKEEEKDEKPTSTTHAKPETTTTTASSTKATPTSTSTSTTKSTAITSSTVKSSATASSTTLSTSTSDAVVTSSAVPTTASILGNLNQMAYVLVGLAGMVVSAESQPVQGLSM